MFIDGYLSHSAVYATSITGKKSATTPAIDP